MGPPFPLHLPRRPAKPRRVGITHVLDKGLPAADLAGVLETCGDYIDIWKFGWGTAYLDPGVEAKLAALAEHGILGCVGGTLLEVAWVQRRVEEFLDWAEAVGFPCIEVSRGAAPMRPDEKYDLIAGATSRFTVLSEVGAKSAADRMACAEWAEEVEGDLAAGARWVLTEGRESGTVGIYDAAGTVREDVVAAVMEAGGVERIVFETPRKDQAVWFIRHCGPDVNLANIPIAEVLGVETLRLGLRADTMQLSTDTVAQR
ncbi:MAG TPA: phosphosulfolactate synthase [Acidimicrobiales bacterium]|nr:phosphosulfolactate synthase [Acidimicrobiales bacterium]